MGDSVHYPSTWFPPVARLDEYVAVAYAPRDIRYYRVTLPPEPIPLYEVGFLLEPAGALSERELEYFVVGEDELLQLRLTVDGVVKIKARLPRAVSRWTLRKESAWIDASFARFPTFPPQTELYVLEDNPIFIDIQNLSADRYEYAKIYMTGYRLVIEEVREKPRAYAGVLVQGFAPRTRVRE